MSAAFINPLQRRSSGLVGQVRAIKHWTRTCLGLAEETVVSVNELACHLPGCPPKETVILVMNAQMTIQASIHKALTDVVEADIVAAAWNEPAAQAPPLRGG